MSISVFDLFKIGIGPSSSHTVGPMWAARRFLNRLDSEKLFQATDQVQVQLFGSLSLTGKGHGTDKAVLLGLAGEVPDRVDPDAADRIVAEISDLKQVALDHRKPIHFDPETDLIFDFGPPLPEHPNGMKFSAYDDAGNHLMTRTYFSVGGGFVQSDEEIIAGAGDAPGANVRVPFAFDSAEELLSKAKSSGLGIARMMMENERTWRDGEEIKAELRNIWQVMDASIRRGCEQKGELPGGLAVKRRAAQIREELTERPEAALRDPLSIMDWVNLYALAVNEENAAGGRVVTAPTNGAAGVIPAVLTYYDRFVPGSDEQGVFRFLLTAAAIGMLYKQNASISAAEVGCQGEVGVACSMAAAGLTAALGGTDAQAENAAEIGMEHNLGLTCDPIGGLVQVPCIERNTMGAVKAINAARLAMRGDGSHFVSLDQVIETMHQTGRDMQTHYKETSQGGLAKIAVNVPEC